MRLLTLAATAIVVVACAAAGPVAVQAETRLEVSYSGGPYTEPLQEIAWAFEERNPGIRISHRTPVVERQEDLLQNTLRAALTGDLPDVSFQGNLFLGVLASRDLPVPLDPLIAAEPDWGSLGYFPSVRTAGVIAGQTRALAFQTSVPILFWNAELVRRAGADPEALPTTWTGINALAKRIAALGTVGAFFDYHSTGNWTFQAMVTSQGGRMMSPDDREILFNGREGMQALEWLRELGQAGMVDMTQAQSIQAFAAGGIGVLASFSAASEQIERGARGRFEVRTSAWPLPDANGRVPAGGRAVMIFTRDPVRQKAAWDYLKFVTGPVGQTILVRRLGAVPNNEIAVRDERYLGRYYEEHPNQRAALALTSNLTAWYAFPGENAVKISFEIRDQLREVLLQRKAPAAAIGDMTRAVQALLPRP